MYSDISRYRRHIQTCTMQDGRVCCRCAHASRTEAVIWSKVGDKLQSCRLKWFMASAESDKFCPLSATNHCSLSQTRPSSPESRRSRSWSQGSHWSTPQNTRLWTHPCNSVHTRTHSAVRSLCMNSLIVKRITIKIQLEFPLFFSMVTRGYKVCYKKHTLFVTHMKPQTAQYSTKISISIMLNCFSVPPLISHIHTNTLSAHSFLSCISVIDAMTGNKQAI